MTDATHSDAPAVAHPSNNPLLVAGAWLVVSLPLAWGVYNTIKTSTKLFQNTAAPVASAPAAPEQKANP